MLNYDIQKNKSSNNNLKWNYIKEFCEVCNRITTYKINKISNKSICCSCLTKNNRSHIKFCKKCNKETFHYFNRCTECQPEYKPKGIHYEYYNNCNKETIHNVNICCECKLISLSLFNNNIIYKTCNICRVKTLHKYDSLSAKFYCQVCTNEKVWCNHCNKWETVERNSIPEHWIFYKSKTKQWINENFNNYVKFLEDNIIGLNYLQDRIYTGIYCWKIDDVPFYIGQAVDILSRCYDHMYNIDIFPEYWMNIKDNFNDHTLSIECLEECSKEFLNDRERYWINNLKPISQKCDGTDNIIPLEKREFNIKNLKEIYKNITTNIIN